jgi:hypothetical protein
LRPFTATLTQADHDLGHGQWGVTFSVTANKPLAFCTISILAPAHIGTSVIGPGVINGNECTGGTAMSSSGPLRVEFDVKSINGETDTNRVDPCLVNPSLSVCQVHPGG